jgi:hypothetical protein
MTAVVPTALLGTAFAGWVIKQAAAAAKQETQRVSGLWPAVLVCGR